MREVPDPVNGMAETMLQTVDALEQECSKIRGQVAQLLMIVATHRERERPAREAA